MRIIRKIMGGLLLLLLLLVGEVWLENYQREPKAELAVSIPKTREEFFFSIRPIPEIIPVRETADLPGAYDYRKEGRAPVVKNQQAMNNCWAFAGTSAMESTLLPQENVQFSTDHMTNCNSFALEPEEGGAYVMAVAYLAAWQGPVLEDQDPSGDGQSPEGLEEARQVLEVRFLDYKDYEAIKRTVFLYGGVESTIYMDFTQEGGSSVSYAPATYSYCYTGETEPNHDVLIIGWDDAYPADRFRNPPEGDGAFICQNSWGEGFGEQGIFYVSYYDTNIGSSTTAYIRVEDAGYFDGLYQSDLCGWTGQVGYNEEEAWFANVYTAQEAEELCAAGFYTTGPESTYELYVVPEFSDEESLNERMFAINGYLQYGGYHTVELPEDVRARLQPGQRFALVIRIKTQGAIYPIAVEYAQEEGTKGNVTLEDGESYISDKGKLWSRTEEECESNVCLKAYVKR